MSIKDYLGALAKILGMPQEELEQMSSEERSKLLQDKVLANMSLTELLPGDPFFGKNTLLGVPIPPSERIAIPRQRYTRVGWDPAQGPDWTARSMGSFEEHFLQTPLDEHDDLTDSVRYAYSAFRKGRPAPFRGRSPLEDVLRGWRPPVDGQPSPDSPFRNPFPEGYWSQGRGGPSDPPLGEQIPIEGAEGEQTLIIPPKKRRTNRD